MFRKLLGVFLVLFILTGCKQPTTPQTINGQTWTTYAVKLEAGSSDLPKLKLSIDSLLAAIDQSVSTYIDSSTISKFNNSSDYDTLMLFRQGTSGDHFEENLKMSEVVVYETNSFFDPTVKPLVEFYGFGNSNIGTLKIDSLVVDSILERVGFFNVVQIDGLHGEWFIEKHPNVQLDFSAIAKGYMVDQVGELLESKGYENYLVEIGGEVKAKGVNYQFSPWSLGIEEPIENSNQGAQINAIIPLSNQSMATSGNYRNFKIIDGQKVVHTINPKTGYPEISNLLSATIITEDCAFADAYATACMVMGLEKSIEWVEQGLDIEAYFIYSDENGELQSYASSGIRDQVIYPD